MMPAAEKTLALALCEMKLLIRNRMSLAIAILLPLMGGLFMGLAGRSTYECPARWGVFVVLPISALVLMGVQFGKQGILPPGSDGLIGYAGLRVSQALAALFVLAVQVAIYAGLAGLVGGIGVGMGVLIGALAASLIIGLAASIMLRPGGD